MNPGIFLIVGGRMEVSGSATLPVSCAANQGGRWWFCRAPVGPWGKIDDDHNSFREVCRQDLAEEFAKQNVEMVDAISRFNE